MAAQSSRQGLSGPIVWVGLAVCVAAVVVQTTRSGVDVLALLLAAFCLLVLERTLGDWIADTLGPGPAALVFAGIALAGLLYVTTGGGRASAARFVAGAEARGYRAAYLTLTGPGKSGDLPNLRVATPASTVSSSAAPATGSLEVVAAATLPGPASGGASASAAGASSVPGVPAAGVRITRFFSSANVAAVNQPITLRADVAADDEGELPKVEFSIDGRVVATAAPAGGTATATWRTRVPGQYVARAHLPGRFRAGVAPSTMITVIPGRASSPRREPDTR
ncbi:MAG: Ig-like domain-containing protein [Vicinamibacterales bacterium]